MRRFVVLLLGLTLALLTACGGDDDGNDTAGNGSEANGAAEGPSVAVLSPFPRDDGGITQLSIQGATRAAQEVSGGELGGIVDNAADPQEQIRGLRNLANANDIVVAASGSLNQATDEVAPDFPDTTFIQLVSATEQFHENVTSVVPQLGLVATVTGAVMANRSETGQVGVVAGLEIPASMQEVAGVEQGSQLIDSDATTASTFTGDYNDVGAANQAGDSQMAEGVDQVLADLDLGTRGLEQSAEEHGAEVFQVFKLDCETSNTVAGSAVVDFAAMSYDAVTRTAEGDLDPGALFITLNRDDIMYLEFCPGKATAEDEEIASRVTRQLNAGEVEPNEGVLNPDPGYDSVTE